jgi:hypothetical protein
VRHPDVTCIHCLRTVPYVTSWKDPKAPEAFFCGAECAHAFNPVRLAKRHGFEAMEIQTAHGTLRVEPTTSPMCPHCGALVGTIHLCTKERPAGALVALWERELEAARAKLDTVWAARDDAPCEGCGYLAQGLPLANLARALFEASDAVHLYVLAQSDLSYEDTPDERFRRNMDLAYARGVFGYEPEHDWADDAWLTAEAVLRILRQKWASHLQGPAKDE